MKKKRWVNSMASRYNNARPFVNREKLYEGVLEKRDVNYIRQYRTGRLRQPTQEERTRLQMISHVWTLGDRLYKLAAKYYNDPKLWWVIAWYNLKPTEAHFKAGEVIYIPLPLNEVLALLQRE
jgi:hypothetical protein